MTDKPKRATTKKKAPAKKKATTPKRKAPAKKRPAAKKTPAKQKRAPAKKKAPAKRKPAAKKAPLTKPVAEVGKKLTEEEIQQKQEVQDKLIGNLGGHKFQKGNKHWMARSRHGRKKLFESSEALLDACCEYFEYVQNTPLHEYKAFAYQGEISHTALPKMRAMSIRALCVFLRVSDESWANWRTDPDFFGVVKFAESVIYNQKFEGAAANLLDSSIIARELGLADKTQTELANKDGQPFQTANTNVSVDVNEIENMDDKAALEAYKSLIHPPASTDV